MNTSTQVNFNRVEVYFNQRKDTFRIEFNVDGGMEGTTVCVDEILARHLIQLFTVALDNSELLCWADHNGVQKNQS